MILSYILHTSKYGFVSSINCNVKCLCACEFMCMCLQSHIFYFVNDIMFLSVVVPSLFVICSVTLFLPGRPGPNRQSGNFIGGYTFALLLGYSLPSPKGKLGLVVMVILGVWRVNSVAVVVPRLGFSHTHAHTHNACTITRQCTVFLIETIKIGGIKRRLVNTN